MNRRSAPSHQPAGPPATAEAGAAHIRALLVSLFDRKDGTGADWRLMLESLYRAGFKLADDQLPDDARRSLMRWVHEGAYDRITGEAGAGQADKAGPIAEPANGVGLKAQHPRPPR